MIDNSAKGYVVPLFNTASRYSHLNTAPPFEKKFTSESYVINVCAAVTLCVCALRHQTTTKERKSAPPSVQKVRVLKHSCHLERVTEITNVIQCIFPPTTSKKKTWKPFYPCTGINMPNFLLVLKEASLCVPVTNCFFAVRKLTALKKDSF